MPESSHFGGHETPPQPRVDFKSVLEKGEIAGMRALEGHERYDVVEIKDDGKALFREELNEPKKEEPVVDRRQFIRSDLELLASKIDEALGFNLVPTIVKRTLNGRNGTLQRFVDNAIIAENLRGDWFKMVDNLEIIKAAVFDYLIDAKDRGGSNFLVDRNARKIWLIDHDHPMLISWDFGSDILRRAIAEGLIELQDDIRKAVENLLVKIDSIVAQDAKPEVRLIAGDIKRRAENLIATGTLA